MKYFLWKYNVANECGNKLRSEGRFCGGSDYSPTKKDAQAIHKILKGYLDEHLNDTFLMPLFEAVYDSFWGNVLRRTQMYKEMFAITDLLISFSDNSSTWFDYAYSASRLEKVDVAEEGYRRCLEFNPSNTGALHNLSLLVEKKNLKEAIELSGRAYEKAPNDKLFKERFEKFRPITRFQKLAEASSKNPIDFDSLSLKDRLYLGAVLMACLSEDQKTIFSVEEANKRLAAGREYETEILSHLWNANILVIDPYGSQAAIGINAEGEEVATLRKARWLLNVKSAKGLSHAKMLTELVEPNLVDDESHDDAVDLWKEMALEESLEYLQYKRNVVDLSGAVSDKTREYFTDLLERFSTAQMFNIVYRAVGNTVVFQKEKRLSNAHAANLVSSNCKQYGDKAMAEGWTLKPYRRNYDVPQSIISELLYNRLLAIGEAGFNCVPGSYPIGAGGSFVSPGEDEATTNDLA